VRAIAVLFSLVFSGLPECNSALKGRLVVYDAYKYKLWKAIREMYSHFWYGRKSLLKNNTMSVVHFAVKKG
jgi:hypothetical protein